MNPTLRFLDHDAKAARIRQVVEDRAKVLVETNPVEAELRFELFLRFAYPREAFEWKPRKVR